MPEKRKRVRQTVDLERASNSRLHAWRYDATQRLERDRAVTVQDVLHAAVDVLLDDDVVARRIRDRLEQVLPKTT